MNYDEARQTKDGVWHWTTMNDNVVRTAAPCIQLEDIPIEEIGTKTINVLGRCNHVTKEEAERHFYEYCFEPEQIREDTNMHWLDCAKCGAPTKRLLGNRGLWSLINQDPLCDEHFGVEILKELHPFHINIKLIHS